MTAETVVVDRLNHISYNIISFKYNFYLLLNHKVTGTFSMQIL